MVKGRKITGGKYKAFRKKKKYSLPGKPRKVKLRQTKKKIIRGIGGNKKTVLLSTEFVNIIDIETKKAKKVKILNVLETPSNRFLARQNILIKGAIIKTEIGDARVTNRPSQEGSVQAVLIKNNS
jgi:small subunit ribosomal protein S8e